MKVDLCDMCNMVAHMSTNGFSYLNKGINRYNYLENDLIDKPFYVSECWIFTTYKEMYDLFYNYFSRTECISALLDSIYPENEIEINFNISKEELFELYFGHSLCDHIHDFIKINVLNKFDEDELCAAPKLIVKSYFENI